MDTNDAKKLRELAEGATEEVERCLGALRYYRGETAAQREAVRGSLLAVLGLLAVADVYEQLATSIDGPSRKK